MGAIAELAAVVLGLVILGLAAPSLRRYVLRRRGGTFDCSLRLRTRNHGQGWAFGIARYAGDGLEWYRVFSLSPRPRLVIARRELVIRGRRKPQGPEATALLNGAIVVECGVDGNALELAMSPDAMTGLLSWLEAAPPGQTVVA